MVQNITDRKFQNKRWKKTWWRIQEQKTNQEEDFGVEILQGHLKQEEIEGYKIFVSCSLVGLEAYQDVTWVTNF